jgi:nitroreductase
MNTGTPSVARLAEDQVRAVLAAADAAPSPAGGRPWRFRCTTMAIELYEDGDVGSPSRPARVLACGGALLNLRLAINTIGVYADVRLAPDPVRPALLASVRPENQRLATTWERQLAHVISRPATNAGDKVTALPAAIVQELRRAAEIEHAWLVRLSDPQLTALHLITDSVDHELARGQLVVVGSLHDDTRALLRAGQAIQRVYLTATTLGLCASFVEEPVATAAARAELRGLIGGALSPHAVLHVQPRR